MYYGVHMIRMFIYIVMRYIEGKCIFCNFHFACFVIGLLVFLHRIGILVFDCALLVFVLLSC